MRLFKALLSLRPLILQVTLLQQLNAIRNQKAATRREQRARQQAQRAKRAAAEEEWRKQYNK